MPFIRISALPRHRRICLPTFAIAQPLAVPALEVLLQGVVRWSQKEFMFCQ